MVLSDCDASSVYFYSDFFVSPSRFPPSEKEEEEEENKMGVDEFDSESSTYMATKSVGF